MLFQNFLNLTLRTLLQHGLELLNAHETANTLIEDERGAVVANNFGVVTELAICPWVIGKCIFLLFLLPQQTDLHLIFKLNF